MTGKEDENEPQGCRGWTRLPGIPRLLQGHAGDGFPDGDEQFFDFRGRQGLQVLEGHALGVGELAAGGAAEFREMGAAAELLPEVVRKGANISAFAGAHDKINLRRLPARELILGYADEARLARNFLAFARGFVEGHAVDFYGGKHGRRLVLVTHEGFYRGKNLRLGERGDGAGLKHLALGVLRVGDFAQRDRAGVFLVRAHEVLRGAGGLANKHDQHAGGHRVERAGVADAPGSQNAAQARDDIVRCVIDGFVDEEDAGEFFWRKEHVVECGMWISERGMDQADQAGRAGSLDGGEPR